MDVQVYKGGTPVVSYGMGEGHPNLYRPPYGKYPFDTSPPFNAHFNGAAGKVDYPAGTPLKPSELLWQRDNLRVTSLAAGDTIQMIVVPCNHWITMMQFDVGTEDARLAGATVQFNVQVVQPAAADPFDWRQFTTAVDPRFTAALTAQSPPAVPLDVPGTSRIYLTDVSTGYAVPLTAEPVFYPDSNVPPVPRRHETGALILGIKIVTMPTDATVKIEDATNDFYLTTRVTGLQCPSFT
jgi:hypothetical protein